MAQEKAPDAQQITILDSVHKIPIPQAVVSGCGVSFQSDSAGQVVRFCEQVDVKAAGYKRAFGRSGERIFLEPFQAKGLYVSHFGVSSRKIMDSAMQLAKEKRINALVIDVKNDLGYLSFKTELPEAIEVGAHRMRTIRDIRSLLTYLHYHDVYTIARIAVFRDDLFAKRFPDQAVKKADGTLFKDNQGVHWSDPFSPKAQAYNLAIAKTAAAVGFDEIQFDYIRFPDHNGLVFAEETNASTRTQNISGFLRTAKAEMDAMKVFFSADIFGYAIWDEGDLGLGQQLEALAPHVDYLSPMLYPSGFAHGIPEYRNPVKNNYEIIWLSLQRAQQRTGLPARKFRPWLQAFRDYAFDKRLYRSVEVGEQIEASSRFGSSGWLLWNPRNDYKIAFEGMEDKLYLSETEAR